MPGRLAQWLWVAVELGGQCRGGSAIAPARISFAPTAGDRTV